MLRRLSCKFLLVIVAAFCFLALIMPNTSFAQGKSPGKRVLIGFKGQAGRQFAQEHKTMISNFGGEVHRSFHIIPVVSARLSEQAIAKLRERPQIDYIEDDVIMNIIEDEIPWGINKIEAPTAWSTSKGAGVHVAILDTGIDYDHPDLIDNIEGGVYFAGWIWDEIYGKDGSTDPVDWNDGHGHGTHCAGIVAAEDNGIGVIGVAPEARLHAVKVLDDNGSGYTSDIVQGIEWCVDNNIDVASMSFGGGGTTSMQSACDAAYAAGVLLVAAAGNDYGGPVIYPAAYDSVIAVSATDSSDTITSFSNIGPQIELAAPGLSIHSTYKGGAYANMSGTSMACPHVSGTAALVIATGISDVSSVRTRLRNTAIDLGSLGKDNYYGYGRVNAAAAVAEPGGPVDNPPNVTITAPVNGNTVSGSSVVVSANASDDNSVTQVQFLVDGSSKWVSTSEPYSISWDSTSVSDGSHTITAIATDSIGQTDSDSITVYVDNVNDRPIADFTYSTSGLTAFFTDTSTDSDGNVVSWSWDFGDAPSSTLRDPTHTYSAPGTYLVTLMVIDDDGATDSVSKNVTVSEAADLSVTITNHSVKTRWDKRNGIGKVEAQISFTVNSGSSNQIVLEEVVDEFGNWSLENTQSEVKINGVRNKWDTDLYELGGINVAVISFNGVTLEAGDDVQIKMKLLNDSKGTHTLRCFILDVFYSFDPLDDESVSWSW